MYKIIFIFIGIFILMYLYIKYNVNTLEVTKYVVENKKVPKEFDGYNIVQISDLHSKLFGENNKKLIQKIKSLNPDIVVVTPFVYLKLFKIQLFFSLKFISY